MLSFCSPNTYNAGLSADFSGDRRFVLAKPVDEKQLDRVLEHIGES